MVNTDELVSKQIEEDRKYRLRAGLFLTSVAGIAAAVGFSKTLITAKKNDPSMFSKGMVPTIEMAESGAQLALRALAWGTVYAVAGTGILCFGVWKLSGATSLQDFRNKIGSTLPKIKKNDPPQSRTEFDGLTDLMTYISTWRKN